MLIFLFCASCKKEEVNLRELIPAFEYINDECASCQIVELTMQISGLGNDFGSGFQYETEDGTAKAGEDYEASSGKVGLSPSADKVIITINILDDSIAELEEQFTIRLFNAQNIKLSSKSLKVVILDND